MSTNLKQWKDDDDGQWVSNDTSQWGGFDYKKWKKIAISSSLIDSDLTDFPLAIPLSTSAGTGADDLSDIFEELKFPASDPFYDGTAFDTTRWELTGQSGNVSMVGNTLQCYADSGDVSNERQGVLSKFKLDYTENFDIRVDFDITAGPSADLWSALMEVYFFDQAGGSVGGPPTWDTGAITRRDYDSFYGHVFGSLCVEDAVWKTTERAVNTVTKGRLRLVFNAATPSIKSYYDSGSGWVAMDTHTLTDVDATNALVCIGVYTTDTDPTVTAKFSNFKVHTGKVIWTDGEPNRKKIKVTGPDLITQYPVEIEHLDVDGQVGMLHTKVPSVSSSTETVLYLHYDCDKPDNSDYVGDAGDTPAQAVWDDDFSAVYHMATDPSGANAFLDSTGNGFDGTMVGTMLTEDLIDGNKGKAIAFDGSNDEFTVADHHLFDIDSDDHHTIESIFRFSTGSRLNCLFDKRQATLPTHGWIFGINTDDELYFYLKDTGSDAATAVGDTTLSVDTWYYGAGRLDRTAHESDVWLNDASDDSTPTDTSAVGGCSNAVASHFCNGSHAGTGWSEFAGDVGEFRISATPRSDAWLKATYHTLFDTLISWEAHQGAWLDDWNYRRQFTVDADYINGELADFPVAIPLSASCGIGTDDLSAIFTELEYTFTGDDFTGDDGDLINSSFWENGANETTQGMSIQSNKLNFSLSAVSQITYKLSKFMLTGDFSIQIDFDTFVHDSTYDPSLFFMVQNYKSSMTDGAYIKIDWSSGERFYCNFKNAGSWTGASAVARTNDYGKLRLRRVGSTIYADYADGGGSFVNLDSYAVGTDDLFVDLQVSTAGSCDLVSGNLDNFLVNSGTVVWPQGTNPNAKRLAITTADKTSECFYEIENFDQANSEAMLHVRVPKILLGKDTELYLYYDSAQEKNTRAGETDDSQAQLVWDSDYVGVWHMTDPDALDSTVNNNDGTAYGDTALVDGLNGAKACEFDEDGDNINLGSDASIDDIALKTIEAVFNMDDYGEVFSGRILDKSLPTNLGWAFLTAGSYTGIYFQMKSSGALGGWSGGTLATGTWKHAAATHDLASINNDPELFVDGAPVSVTEQGTPSGTWTSESTAALRIGIREAGDREFDGKIGEVRISKIIRSDAWIKATYRTLFDTLATWSALETWVDPESTDVYVILEAPAEITYTIPGSVAIAVSVEPAAPAEITYSVPGAAEVGVGVDVGTPEITYSVPGAEITQNFNAIGIMSKPLVSAKGPSAIVTAKGPGAIAAAGKLIGTATGKGPSATASAGKPTATVTAKGD